MTLPELIEKLTRIKEVATKEKSEFSFSQITSATIEFEDFIMTINPKENPNDRTE